MPIALLIPGLVFVGALVLVALAQTASVTSRSQTEAQASFWKTILQAVTGRTYVKAITTQFRASVSRWALAQLAPVTRWFIALNAVLTDHLRSVALAEHETARAFERLRNVIIPRATGRAVAPVKVQARTAKRAADHANSRAAHANTAVTHLGATVKPQIRANTHRTTIALPRDIADVRGRVKGVERELEHPHSSLLHRWAKLLWVAGLAGLFVRALAKRFPWLFCRKVQTVGKRLCGLDDSLLQGLLDATLVIAGTVSVVEFVRDAQAVEKVALDALAGFIREMPQA